MNCCQCQGIEELFSEEHVRNELKHYRSKGPDKTTRMLTEAIQETGVDGMTLLDIGGGVGAIQHDLMAAGVRDVTCVDASSAYLNAAKEEAKRRGYTQNISFQHGNFVDLASQVDRADIVTLDRVICCYPDMQKLVDLSARQARRLYGLVYPRDSWWIKMGLGAANLYFKLRRSNFRTFVHPSQEVESLLEEDGFQRRSHRQTLIWQVAVYERRNGNL